MIQPSESLEFFKQFSSILDWWGVKRLSRVWCTWDCHHRSAVSRGLRMIMLAVEFYLLSDLVCS